jgi:adenylyltransferase/sulfurtransferase
MSRYDRQMRLSEVGILGQKKLSQARVLCVGAGGLGSPVMLYLASAGIGTIGVIDGDKVDTTNLQRQILFEEADLGQSKAQTAKIKLHKLNSEINVVAYETFLNTDNAENIFQAYDLIIDGTDNFGAKFLINLTAKNLNKPWVYGSVTGFEGRIAVFEPQGPCLRCLFPQTPKQNLFSCAELGVLGAMVGWIGSIQALKAIQYFLLQAQKELGLDSELIVADGLNFSQTSFKIIQSTECPVCAASQASLSERLELNLPRKSELNLEKNKFSQNAENQALQIEPLKLNFDPENYLLIDLCEERAPCFFKSAERYSMGDLFSLNEPPKTWQHSPRPILLFCEQGYKSLSALNYLLHLGLTNISHIEGGLCEYKKYDF